MFVGVSRLDLRIPASGSLKTKRHVVKRITGGVRAKFNAAVAEVDHQDQWQRTAIGVACVSETRFHTERMLREIERFVLRDDRVELLGSSMTVHGWSDLE